MAFGQDDAFISEPFETAGDRRFGEPGAMVEHSAIAGGDPGDHLGEGNGVGVPFEAEGAPDDVEQHAQLGIAQGRHQDIEELIGDLGVAWAGEALERRGVMIVWRQTCPPM